MVKRPFNLAPLSSEVSARFVSPVGAGCSTCRSLRDRRAIADASSPPDSDTLLSAQEATERLRQIVDGFFFRHRNGQGQISARQL